MTTSNDIPEEMNEGDFGNKIRKVQDMNRSERRSRIKFYKAEWKKHIAKKPVFNIETESPEERVNQQNKINAWASRRILLLKKLEELGVKKIKE